MWCAACGSGDDDDADDGLADAGPTRDAGTIPRDGGTDDIGRRDAGATRDAGVRDAGPLRFSVAGTVTGLEGEGLSLALQVAGSEDLLDVTSDTFVFPDLVDDGTVYEVTVRAQPIAPVQACEVTNGAGTVLGADVSLDVRCTTPTTRFIITSDSDRSFVNAIDPYGWARAWRRLPAPNSAAPVVLATHPTEPWIFRQNSNGIVTRVVEPDGRLTSTSTLTTLSGRSLALRIGPGGRAFALVNGGGVGEVSTLDVGPNGALTVTSTAPATFPGLPVDMVLDPEGRFLWGLGFAPGPMSAVHPFTIDANGALTPASPTSVPVGFGTLAFAAGANLMLLAGVDGVVYQFSVGVDGQLTPLATPSLPLGSSGPSDVVVEPSGRFAYITSQIDDTISAFEISTDGLIATGTVAALGQPQRIVADPSGQFVAVLNAGALGPAVTRFRIGTNGALTFHDSSPAASGQNIVMIGGAPLQVDSERLFVQTRPSGQALEHRLQRYEIDGQGQLVLADEVETGTGNFELGVVADFPGENVYATAFLPNDQDRLAHFDTRTGGLTPVSPGPAPFDVFVPWVALSPRGDIHLEGLSATPVDGRLPQMMTTRQGAYMNSSPPVFDPSGRWAWIVSGPGWGPTPAVLSLPLGAQVEGDVFTGFSGEFVVSPNGRFAWSGSSVVAAAAIDRQTGAMTALPNPPELTFPVSAAVHPSGRFVFVSGLQQVWSFAVGADGSLTQVGMAMSPNVEFERRVTVSPSGRYLYVMAFGVGAQANQFAIEDDGTLTPLTPFSIPMWTDSVAASATWR